MKQMFNAATLKLTAWYLVILVAICLIFSFIIFGIATSEISSRLERLQIRLEGSNKTVTLPGPLTLTDLRESQTEQARTSLFVGLVYINLAVVSLGGVGSFVLARRTLRPIEAAHRVQSQFTADASHELRTPLAAMKSELQVSLRDPAMTKQQYKELAASTLEEVEKLTVLSQSLLRLSQTETISQRMSERIHLNDAVKDAIGRLKQPSGRIDYKNPNRAFYVDGDKAMILELFTILLDNAVKYSPSDSTVSVAVSSNGRHCQVAISNAGEGIKKADLERVFDRFYRASRSRTNQATHGYGIGLALAKRITEAHHGTISLKSTPGKLTTATVSLPHIHHKR